MGLCKPEKVWYTGTDKKFPAAGQGGGPGGFTMKGSAFRVAGLVLGIVAAAAAVVAIALSAVGMSKARQCKQCKLGGKVK